MNKEKLVSFIGIGTLFLLLIFGGYGYFVILSPLHQKVETVDSQITQQEALLKSLDGKPKNSDSTLLENTHSLQEEVPVKSLVDQLLLQFEKAEVLSDSLILTMNFTDGETTENDGTLEGESPEEASAPESQPTDGANNGSPETSERTDDSQIPEEEPVTPEENVTPLAPEVLPEGVKKITAEMSVVSKDYAGLVKFLKTIQEQKRITIIEAISFAGTDELEAASADAVTDQLKYEITISAYYLPELTDYLKDLPKGEFPAPNGKDNPLINNDEE
ncbi:hypothetical protein IHV12_03810 [Fictibacillus sp. 7GRE50]|uniref:hypothetical protein n=1 Tax=Fictibacillus sp. 7GRE50 TaxID=2745878 RepID=UPI0018CC8704|nr:hypothetical protein [Fictibacillus sp. 7GRE50]MBH0164024.1 hypothetical protein [Fictibacillus sp. 7GRE50]